MAWNLWLIGFCDTVSSLAYFKDKFHINNCATSADYTTWIPSTCGMYQLHIPLMCTGCVLYNEIFAYARSGLYKKNFYD